MNEIQVFENEEFGQVRTIIINDEAYFVGKDVAKILGYKDPTKAVREKVDNEDRWVSETDPHPIIDNLGRTQNPTWINESGLYSLILSSKLPTAKKFKRWVTSDVLPSIRKHGLYATDELLNNPDFAIKVFTALKEEKEKNAQLTITVKEQGQKIEEQKPLVEFAEKVSHSDNLINMGKMAKLLKDSNINIGRNKLFEWLRDKGILMSDNIPYQKYIDSGYFEVKESVFCTSTGYKTGQTTLVTGRGQVFIHKKLQEEYCA